MNAEGELLRAYREWHRLAQAETKAIQTRNWKLLSDCHRAIRDFQTLAAGLTQAARHEWHRSGCNLAEKEIHLRALVSGLVDRTRRNHELLRVTLAATRQQLHELTEAGKNLQRLRRSYGAVAARVRAR
jgi:hypothetical protein